jgi:hypothetical protein
MAPQPSVVDNAAYRAPPQPGDDIQMTESSSQPKAAKTDPELAGTLKPDLASPGDVKTAHVHAAH